MKLFKCLSLNQCIPSINIQLINRSNILHTSQRFSSTIKYERSMCLRNAFYTKSSTACLSRVQDIYSHNRQCISLFHDSSPLCNPDQKEGIFSRLFYNRNQAKLVDSGTEHYINIAKNTDVMYYFKLLSLPDTFMSWYLIMELHVWLLSARLGREGKDGKIVRDSVIKALWMDVENKIRNLGKPVGKKRHNLEILLSHFQFSLIFYDEGLLGNDRDLANAVWYNIIRREVDYEELEDDEKESPTYDDIDYSEEDLEFILAPTKTDPLCLEIMVQHIRKQIQQLDEIPSEDILMNSKSNWLKPQPLLDC